MLEKMVRLKGEKSKIRFKRERDKAVKARNV